MPNNMIKTVSIIAAIKKAAAIIDDVYDFVLETIKEGISETELANSVYNKIIALGGKGTSFDTIVAFGENGCEPHHVPNEKKLEKGMLVTLDMGTVVDGFCSDFTRTFAFGGINDEQKKIYDIVYRSQKAALKVVVPGVKCVFADKVARDIIEEQGYGEYYIHGTGHGVGELIHEPPTLNAKSEETLELNEVVTVEPGIYLPGKMGVRIEDMIVVGESAPVSRHNTELIIIN